MRVNRLLVLLILFGFFTPAEAQQPSKVPKIGFLVGPSRSFFANRIESFEQGLHSLGYTERKNVVIEYRFADGKADRLPALAAELVGLKLDVIVATTTASVLAVKRASATIPNRLPALAAELVRLKVDIIVTDGSRSTRSAKEATTTIPIIMLQDPDPVGNGFVAILARPGGNITGLSNLAPELSGKRLELLKEVVPKLSRVAVFGSSTFPGNAQNLRETELASGAFGVKLQYLDVLRPEDIETAFRSASKSRVDAVLLLASPIHILHRKQLADLAVKSRLPAIYNRPEYVEDGGLMAYSPNVDDMFRRAATYVDKILARGSSCRAAGEIRVRYQSQSRETDWPHDSAECAGESG